MKVIARLGQVCPLLTSGRKKSYLKNYRFFLKKVIEITLFGRLFCEFTQIIWELGLFDFEIEMLNSRRGS